MNQHEFKWWKRFQSMGLGAVLLALGGLAGKGCEKLDVVNTAMAQTQAQGATNTRDIATLTTRLETVDAGTGQKVERLERKIDANNEQTEKKLERMQATLELLVREVRKK